MKESERVSRRRKRTREAKKNLRKVDLCLLCEKTNQTCPKQQKSKWKSKESEKTKEIELRKSLKVEKRGRKRRKFGQKPEVTNVKLLRSKVKKKKEKKKICAGASVCFFACVDGGWVWKLCDYKKSLNEIEQSC